MIRRWFVSYPRLLAVTLILAISSLVAVSLCIYQPDGPSLLVRQSIWDTCSWSMYICNSIAHYYLAMCGWSGILLFPIFWVLAAQLLEIVTVSYLQLGTAVMLVYAYALWCTHIGYEPFPHVVPGGWIGMATYPWLAALCKAYAINVAYVLQATLAVTSVATFRVQWITYVTPYARRVGSWMYYGCGYILRLLRVHKAPSVFTPVVREHIAQEAAQDDDEHQIFHDAFWYKMRSSHEHAQMHMSPDHDVPEVDTSHMPENEVDIQQVSPQEVHQDNAFIRAPHVAQQNVVTPDMQLLDQGPPRSAEPDAIAQQQARRLEEKLATFGITGHVTHITCGPVVTLFSYQPDKAVKVANITAREDDLRLALEAVSLRIIAPIPGTSVVGFEVSRPQPEAVTLRQLLDEQTFWEDRVRLPLALGTDTAGAPYIADLTQMPHLLVAGSTGSGKSVALHSFLVSLLYRCHPDAMKLVLIDPKRLEFVAYQDVPHLASPVVTQSRSVVKTFEWLVREMERRYDEMAHAGVRNITEYHARYGERALPYIVVVIDELADLMMGVGKDIEQYIARLAQMARAAGIHLIVATQRPSVDVVTGMIKVNFLSRIAFKVTSKIDSRTIVDQPGAEKLLGRGDMLYLDARGVIHRLHGGYIKQNEIEAVIQHWNAQPYDHQYLFDPAQQEQASAADDSDELYPDVVAYVQACDTISISLIQRRFRIGYNRSARLVDMLERDGIVSAADSNKMRRVLQ